jgi:hypothetical protein
VKYMDQVLYTKEMAKSIREVKPPFSGIKLDIRKRPNYISLTIHEDNIMDMSESKRMQVMEYLIKVRSTIQNFGVRCEIEGINYV